MLGGRSAQKSIARWRPEEIGLNPIAIRVCGVLLFVCAFVASSDGLAQTTPRYTVLGYNELGMHCMNQDFRDLCILPPFNTLRAQVIDRNGEHPRIVTSGPKLEFSIPGNTTSFTKTNFWTYSRRLFGVSLPPDIGLTGNGMQGQLMPSGDNDWIVTGIPITPVKDNGETDPFQLALLTLRNKSTNAFLADTRAVVPVSWEINCNLCHGNARTSVSMDILRDHDRLHGTQLTRQRPVLCAGCHADPALGTTGQPGVSAFSHAMHRAHAPRMARLNLQNDCYACHPGINQECQRDVHVTLGINCVDCHGNMDAVADPTREPWVDQPTCAQCHQAMRPNFDFEEPGKLFKDSKGHGGVHCAACHGPQHAVGPAVTDADNVQAILKQGHAGVINTCSVCHATPPHDPFFHKRDDD